VVEVRVPAEIEVEIKEDDFLLYLLDHYKLIYWKKTNKGKEIANMIIDEYKELSDNETAAPIPEIVEFLRQKLCEGKTRISSKIYDLIQNEEKKKYVTIWQFKTVKVLKAGDSFGETSLLRN
jgi:hypothetical protein